MMTLTSAPVAALWLLVVNLGIAAGAGLYEHRIVVSRWRRAPKDGPDGWNAAAALEDDPGRRFWGVATTVPLTLLVIANLAAAWHAAPGVQAWWLASSGIALAERLLTFGYFIPAMVTLMSGRLGPEAATVAATRWDRMNYARNGLVCAAWLCALRTTVLLS